MHVQSYSSTHLPGFKEENSSIQGVPLTGRLLLWLTAALVDGRNLIQNMHLNIANAWMNNAV